MLLFFSSRDQWLLQRVLHNRPMLDGAEQQHANNSNGQMVIDFYLMCNCIVIVAVAVLLAANSCHCSYWSSDAILLDLVVFHFTQTQLNYKSQPDRQIDELSRRKRLKVSRSIEILQLVVLVEAAANKTTATLAINHCLAALLSVLLTMQQLTIWSDSQIYLPVFLSIRAG